MIITTNHFICLGTDDCKGSPCSNGRVCQYGINSFTCVCPLGFSGKECEISMDYKYMEISIHLYIYFIQVYIFSSTNFVFHFLFLDIDDCQPNPCLNGGTCVDGLNSFTCDCINGFIGSNCSISKLVVFDSFMCLVLIFVRFTD